MLLYLRNGVSRLQQSRIDYTPKYMYMQQNPQTMTFPCFRVANAGLSRCQKINKGSSDKKRKMHDKGRPNRLMPNVVSLPSFSPPTSFPGLCTSLLATALPSGFCLQHYSCNAKTCTTDATIWKNTVFYLAHSVNALEIYSMQY